MHKVVDGRETLLQAKADCAKGDAVGEGDVPDDEDGHRQETDWLYYKHVYKCLYLRGGGLLVPLGFFLAKRVLLM